MPVCAGVCLLSVEGFGLDSKCRQPIGRTDTAYSCSLCRPVGLQTVRAPLRAAPADRAWSIRGSPTAGQAHAGCCAVAYGTCPVASRAAPAQKLPGRLGTPGTRLMAPSGAEGRRRARLSPRLRWRCVLWLAAALLAAAAQPWSAADAAGCDVSHTLLPDGSLRRGSLEPGCAVAFVLAPGAGQCPAGSYLAVELWDLRALADGSTKNGWGPAGGAQADPLLGLARGVEPRASFVPPSSWSLAPPSAAFDRAGYQLARPYMQARPACCQGARAKAWQASS